MAARCLSETLWQEALGNKKPIPPFMSEVLIRKRHWKTEELLPTQEKAKYLAPSWVHHGHWVEHENGFRTLTRMVMKGLREPVQDHHWIGLEVGPLNQLKLGGGSGRRPLYVNFRSPSRR